jgi:GTP-binding protein HflX
MGKLKENAIFISAKNKTNIDELKTLIYTKAREIHIQRFPYNDFLYQTYDEETEM